MEMNLSFTTTSDNSDIVLCQALDMYESNIEPNFAPTQPYGFEQAVGDHVALEPGTSSRSSNMVNVVSEADLPAPVSADQLQSTIDMPVLVSILALSGPHKGFMK